MKYGANFIAFALLVTSLSFPFSANGQSGGQFSIINSVVAAGGGQNATGGTFSLDGTIGQTVAGDTISGPLFNIKSGFFTAAPRGTTAADVSVSGRVTRENGTGLKRVRVFLNGGTLTAPRIALTNGFGYFTFEDVEVGQTYVVSVVSKRFGFGQNSQIISLVDNVTDLVFISTWQN